MVNPTMAEMKREGLFEDAKEKYENTSKSWKKRWWAVVCEIWENFTEWQEKYDLNMDTMTIIKKTIKKIVSRTKKNCAKIIEKVPVVFAKGTKICYLFKFYDSNGELLFSKIGTTERTVGRRLNEEISQYSKKYDINKAVVESVFDCGTIHPEGAESAARAEFIMQNPTSFIKNDRFLGFDIKVEDFNNCVQNYLDKCNKIAA